MTFTESQRVQIALDSVSDALHDAEHAESQLEAALDKDTERRDSLSAALFEVQNAVLMLNNAADALRVLV